MMDVGNVVIRPFQPGDIKELIDLCEEHAHYEGCDYDRNGKANCLLNFIRTEKVYCLVMESRGKVMGYATYVLEFSTWNAGYYLHMDCLYLRPELRGSGIGGRVVKAIQDESGIRGCVGIQWQTPIENIDAIRFYHRIGATSKVKMRFYL